MSLAGVEPCDQAAIVKPLVPAKDYRSYAARNFGKAGFEKVDGAAGSGGVAGAKFSVPEVSALAFEAEQRMLRRPPALDRIVTFPSLFLPAVNYQHRRVDIEDKSRRDSAMDREAMKETIV